MGCPPTAGIEVLVPRAGVLGAPQRGMNLLGTKAGVEDRAGPPTPQDLPIKEGPGHHGQWMQWRLYQQLSSGAALFSIRPLHPVRTPRAKMTVASFTQNECKDGSCSVCTMHVSRRESART